MNVFNIVNSNNIQNNMESDNADASNVMKQFMQDIRDYLNDDTSKPNISFHAFSKDSVNLGGSFNGDFEASQDKISNYGKPITAMKIQQSEISKDQEIPADSELLSNGRRDIGLKPFTIGASSENGIFKEFQTPTSPAPPKRNLRKRTQKGMDKNEKDDVSKASKTTFRTSDKERSRKFRQRKKRYYEGLEKRVSELEEQNEKLSKELDYYKEKLQGYQSGSTTRSQFGRESLSSKFFSEYQNYVEKAKEDDPNLFQGIKKIIESYGVFGHEKVKLLDNSFDMLFENIMSGSGIKL